jgi:hypothetical protein
MCAMGLRPFAPQESVSASFVCIVVYEMRGVALQSPGTSVSFGEVKGVSYRLGIGPAVNETCRAVSGDVFVDDESAWAKDKSAVGPFLIVQLGPTSVYTATTGYIGEEFDGALTTHDAFPELRADLAALEEEALPRLVTSISCSLCPPDQYLELRKIDRVSVGRTGTGKAVHDLRFVVSASAYGSRGVSPELVLSGLEGAMALAARVNAKAARFFALGMAEEVELKRFLYFFLALEVETHAVFGRIDHSLAVERLLGPGSNALPSASAILKKQVEQMRNLVDRFVWNATCVWSGITEADIDQFKLLKSARDGIAHGTLAEAPVGYAIRAQQLARKLLRH